MVLHAALFATIAVIPKPERAEAAAIELADIKKRKEPPKPPPPPPPPPPKDKPKPPPPPQHAQAQAKAAPDSAKAPPPSALMPMSEDGFADLGRVALGNGGGGDGVGIPTAGATRAATAGGGGTPPPKAVTKKAVQQLAATGADECTQPVVRPKRTVGVQAKYTNEARQAEIEGLIRIEVTVDESGHVLSARVLNGLGYGLDDAALEAAKKCVFEPATLCGKPVVGTAIVAQRFELE